MLGMPKYLLTLYFFGGKGVVEQVLLQIIYPACDFAASLGQCKAIVLDDGIFNFWHGRSVKPLQYQNGRLCLRVWQKYARWQ